MTDETTNKNNLDPQKNAQLTNEELTQVSGGTRADCTHPNMRWYTTSPASDVFDYCPDCGYDTGGGWQYRID